MQSKSQRRALSNFVASSVLENPKEVTPHDVLATFSRYHVFCIHRRTNFLAAYTGESGLGMLNVTNIPKVG